MVGTRRPAEWPVPLMASPAAVTGGAATGNQAGAGAREARENPKEGVVVYLHGAGPLRRLSRLLAGVLTVGSMAVTASALPSEAASASVHHLEGPAGVSASAFGANFAVMARFGPLARAGRGKLAVLLPGSDVPGTDVPGTTATAGGDRADLERAFRRAGLTPTQYVVQTADGSDATQYSDAVRDVSDGAAGHRAGPDQLRRRRAD